MKQPPLTFDEIIALLESNRSESNIAGMARFGIRPKNAYGITVTQLRQWAKRIPTDHTLALKLWKTGIHEARVLAAFVDEPEAVTEKQMEAWARAFDSWDVCDQVCGNLFDRTPFAEKKIVEWSEHPEEFVKRAAFALMAAMAVHDKKCPDRVFESFFPILVRESEDERNFVRKSVNWALRQIGKRNATLHPQAVRLAQELAQSANKTARWIGKDALRELGSDAVAKRIMNR